MDLIKKTLVKENSKFSLSDVSTDDKLGMEGKKEAKAILEKNRTFIEQESDKLYANKSYSMLCLLQAMDAGKKDSTIKHVFKNVPPQLTSYAEFNVPSKEELAHDYLWRIVNKLPRRGQIGVFNRSHYEEVIVTRVHPEFIENQNIPEYLNASNVDDKFWEARFDQINNFEKHLHENGYVILKFFLNMSEEKQRKRFLRRIRRHDKKWKFESKDMVERQLWDKYQKAYENVLQQTSKEHAPWYVIPADHKWIVRATVSEIVANHLKNLKLEYPELSDSKQKEIKEARKELEK